MKEKILAQLKVKFPGVQNSILGLIADALSAKVTEDAQIEGAITELESSPLSITQFNQLMQSEGDKRVTEAIKKQKPVTTQQAQASDADENDPIAKKIAELDAKLAKIEQAEQQKTLHESFVKKLTEKKIPASLAKGVKIEKPEDIETAFAEVETTYNELKQGLYNQGFGSQSPVLGSEGRTDNVDADIKAWAEKSAAKKP